MADKVDKITHEEDEGVPAAKKLKLSPTKPSADVDSAEPKPEAAKESKDSTLKADNGDDDTEMTKSDEASPKNNKKDSTSKDSGDVEMSKVDEPSPKKGATADATKDASSKDNDVSKSDEPSPKKAASADETSAIAAEPTSEKSADSPASKLESSIIRQIEYYFGDANLARDKFLMSEIEKDNGWVPFTVLLTFKRLAAISTDIAAIVGALKKSDEGLIEIHEDETKIRRHPERPLAEQNEETRKEVISRTAYVKGFKADTLMEQLIDFFQPYERVVNIVMRKYLDKPTKVYKFKGSVFVTFQTREQCDEFLKKEKICFTDDEATELERKWQSDYHESKKLERDAEKKKNNSKKTPEPQFDLPKGAVIHLVGLGDKTMRETIKEKFTELGGEVAFIDYNKGDKSGHVRLNVENSAKPIVDKFDDSKIKIDDNDITCRVLEGDEEKEFLEKVVENIKSRRSQGNSRFGRGRHNRNQNRKRTADD